jgi:polyisoprenoid-binding protein YceI
MITPKNLINAFLFLTIALFGQNAFAGSSTYEIDPTHTFPTFEADHMGGLSKWRGKINSTSGTVSVDLEAETGAVDIKMDMSSIDFGLEDMNDHAKSDDMFDVDKFPTATYVGPIVFEQGNPSYVNGELTLHGVTQPVQLKISGFKCIFHPMKLKEACGAEATATIKRDDFGVDYAKAFGFDMTVLLRVGIEAFETN